MSDSIITVENLGKKYVLGHQKTERYTALRDVMAEQARNLSRRVRRPFGNGAAEQDGAHEEFWALKDVSFEVKQGDRVGIIGRNGAGKSTLLKVLSRITEPTTGRVHIKGRVASLLEVGTGFHPELTGRENIYLNGAILGMGKAEIKRKFDEIVAFAEVEKFLDTPVKRYSSGMYVRLAFAVAAHLEPEILIVDEVLAVGDAQFQKKCLGKMQDVAHGGRTVLFVSHNITAIQQLCKTILMMKSGMLVDSGPIDRVLPSYFSDATYSKDGDFDLSQHPMRPTQYSSIIKRVRLSNGEGVQKSVFYPDEEMIIEIDICAVQAIRRPRCAVALEDNLGRRILTTASYFQQDTLPDIESPCVVSCKMPSLDLGTGRYQISVSISDQHSKLLDSLDNVIWIEVEWRNNYGNGELYNATYGPVIKSSIWESVSST